MDIGNLTDTYLNNVAQQSSTSSKLSENLSSKDYSKSTDDELLSACKEFESYFLEQVFKEMQKTVDCFKDENSTSNYSNSMLNYFRDETLQDLAETSTENQGLGLAQTLYEQMKRNYNL